MLSHALLPTIISLISLPNLAFSTPTAALPKYNPPPPQDSPAQIRLWANNKWGNCETYGDKRTIDFPVETCLSGNYPLVSNVAFVLGARCPDGREPALLIHKEQSCVGPLIYSTQGPGSFPVGKCLVETTMFTPLLREWSLILRCGENPTLLEGAENHVTAEPPTYDSSSWNTYGGENGDADFRPSKGSSGTHVNPYENNDYRWNNYYSHSGRRFPPHLIVFISLSAALFLGVVLSWVIVYTPLGKWIKGLIKSKTGVVAI